MRRRAIAAGLAALVAAPAWAGPVYFHKPQVPREAFIADATECEELAGGVTAPQVYQPPAANVYAAGAGAFLAGLMRSRERRGMTENVLRTCMADKGYRRVEASKAARGRLTNLNDAERVDRLAELAAAPEPDGKVLPR